MSNLTLTIISIILIAVAAIMGIYYGGTAMGNGSVSAYATTTISLMQQIKAAVYVYQSYNPGVTNTTTITNAITANNSLYLAKSPYYSSYSSWNVNYGSAGNILDGNITPLSGTSYLYSGFLRLLSDSNGNLFVAMILDMGTSNSTVRTFYSKLCYTINQQMGAVPYNLALTTATYYGSLVPYNNTGYAPYGGTTSAFYSNTCMMTNNPYLAFAIPI